MAATPLLALGGRAIDSARRGRTARMPPPPLPSVPPSLWDKLPSDIERRIFAYALASQLRRPSLVKSDLWNSLGRTRRIDHPPSLCTALSQLAEHLGSPVDAPGEEEPIYMGVQCHRHRLLRHDELHLVRTRWVTRFPRPSRRWKPETRCWTLEALDLAGEPYFADHASERALATFGASPEGLRERGGAHEAMRLREEWDALANDDGV